MKNFSTRALARGAMIAALYAVLTLLLQPLSFGAIQFRVSEALTVMPMLAADAVPGLAVGCLLANLLGGAPWFDVLFGTLATLLAALATRKLRGNPTLATAMPVLFNGLIVGPVVYFAYELAPGAAVEMGALWTTVATVALGEAVVCMVLGRLLYAALEKAPEKLWK